MTPRDVSEKPLLTGRQSDRLGLGSCIDFLVLGSTEDTDPEGSDFHQFVPLGLDYVAMRHRLGYVWETLTLFTWNIK